MAGKLTAEARRVVTEQRLAFVATVCPDGTPNVSPKGTIAVWDDDHLVFADIRSPGTVANISWNPAVELNIVDPFSRKGFRFKARRKSYVTATLCQDLRFLPKPPGQYERREAWARVPGICPGEGGTSLAAHFSRL